MKKLLLLSVVLILCACTQTPGGTGGNTSSSSSSEISMMNSSTSTMSEPTSSVSSAAMSGAMKTFTDPVRKYSIYYPASFTMVANDNLTTDDYEATGTSFTYPESYASGNTLLEAKVNIAVQPSCPALQDTTTSGIVIRNGISYSTGDWSGVGAGNLYQGRTYTTVHDNACYILTLYLHSCNLGPDCYAGHTTPFEKQPLVDLFERMVNSFTFLP